VADDVPPGPVARCPGVTPWQCNEGDRCNRLEFFEPIEGPGYTNYPLNGETNNDQYRSYCRRDLRRLIQHAAGMVDCLSADWAHGNTFPLGLGDMSESNGAIPGSREGDPGHPPGTHVDGFDMDIAYYQLDSPNNFLRSVCPHTSGGRDQYHCTSAPDNLDVWRTALFIGYLHATPQLRVIGVDGRIGELVDAALDDLCAAGYLDNAACNPNSRATTYEVQDMGRGWFRFHHHHLHVSLTTRENAGLQIRLPASTQCLTRDCAAVPAWQDNPHLRQHLDAHHGHELPMSLPVRRKSLPLPR